MKYSSDVKEGLNDAIKFKGYNWCIDGCKKILFFCKSSFLECMVMVTLKLHLYSICRIVKEQPFNSENKTGSSYEI